MTNLLRTSVVLLAALALSMSACGKSKDKQPAPAAAKPADKAPAKTPSPMTDEQFATKLMACWAAFDAKDDAKLASCYTDTSEHSMADMVPPMSATGAQAIVAAMQPFRIAFPDLRHDLQLVLVGSKKSAVVFLVKGTNTGSLMGAPPTGKPIGYLGIQVIDRTATGDVVKDTITIDQSTMMGQLGLSPAPHPDVIEALADKPTVVFADGGETETANVATINAGFEAFNAHDAAKLATFYTDDAVFKYVPEKDEVKGKDAFAKSLTDYFKMTSDVNTELTSVWAAGDYVVAEGVSAGTNDGAMGEMKATNKPYKVAEVHVYKLADGKVAEHWVFGNSLSFAVQVGLVDPAQMAPPQKPAQ